MNIKNNKRRKESKEKIENVFIQLLQTKEINEITVSEICKKTGLNRSTFYANYADVYDLADTMAEKLEQEVNSLYEYDTFNNCSNDYLKLFRHIKDNQIFYKTYFKLGYDNKHIIDLDKITPANKIFPDDVIEYHIEFHKAGLNAVIKKWLYSGCVESPEKIVSVIESEYSNRRLTE